MRFLTKLFFAGSAVALFIFPQKINAENMPAAETGKIIENDLLAGLRADHPRLLLTPADWKNFSEKQKSGDRQFHALMAQLKKNADALLDAPTTGYEKQGFRLLGPARQILERVLTLSVVYRATGEEKYRRRAEKEMLAAAAFPDWNRAHFLDTAETAAGLALGYDWLYADLTPAARQTIREALIEKALRGSTDPKKNGWHRHQNNWIQVCWGGLSLAALAVAEDEPALASEVLAAARKHIHRGLAPYAPDGIYPEGPSYWDYGTTYQVLMIAALESALGTDWDLAKSPGFMASARVQLLLNGATGVSFNFSDGGEQSAFAPASYWFARKLNDPALFVPPVKNTKDRFLTLAALWWPENESSGKTHESKLPLAWHGNGINPVATFRSDATDPNALYLACKAGSARSPHGHMDAGSFVFELDGVRWSSDLGAQDYHSLESKGISIWNYGQNAQRWQIFRLNNFAHSTLTLGEQLHVAEGRTEFTEFSDGSGNAGGHFGATIDMTPVFEGQAKKAVRRFSVNPEKRSAAITDEICGMTAGTEARWAMVTKADVETRGNEAILRKNGKMLRARVSEKQLQFETIPAEPPKDGFNAPNPGTNLLLVRTKAPATGNVTITVELMPTK